MTLPGRQYIGGTAKIRNPHISVLYIVCEVKFESKCIQLNQVKFYA